jgi:hypothetical protein
VARLHQHRGGATPLGLVDGHQQPPRGHRLHGPGTLCATGVPPLGRTERAPLVYGVLGRTGLHAVDDSDRGAAQKARA